VLLGCAHAGVINTLRYALTLHPGLPLVAVLGGMMVLAPCLLYWSFRSQGDVKALLLGQRRART